MNLNKVTRLIKGGTLSEENEIKAKRKRSSLTKTKKDLKREYMNKQFGFKDKKDIGKVSKNDNVNDKSIDEQMAEMEIIDERTYKEYKEENSRYYKRVLKSFNKTRTNLILKRQLKRSRSEEEKDLIRKEMKGNKREFFNEAFKK